MNGSRAFQTSSQIMNQTDAGQREKAGSAEASLASKLLLIGAIIVNTIKEDNMLILASVLNVIAVLLLRKAAFLEADEQQIAPGVTTFANNLKLIATPLSVISSVLLLWALLIEVSLKQPITGISPAPAAAGSSGAILIQ